MLSDKWDFHMIDNLSIAVHTFATRTFSRRDIVCELCDMIY